MTNGIFRIQLEDGSHRLAVGTPKTGPVRMLVPDLSLDRLLADRADLAAVILSAIDKPLPSGARVVAPVESQEVWAAGVTYLRSRDARVKEAIDPTPYDLVYEAERPELFFKSPGWRSVGPGEPI